MKSCASAIFGRFDNLLVGGVERAVGDVLADGAVEEIDILADEADGAAQVFDSQIAQVMPIETDAALLHVIEAQKQFDQGGLSGAGRADDADRLPGRYVQRQIMDDRLVIRILIFEADVFELDVAVHCFGVQGGFPIGEQGVGIQQVEGAVGGGHGALVEVEGVAQAGERPEQALGDEDQDGIDADRQRVR